ncbi:tRNA (adenosine(37)-N6)-threonylcarbamoyltransferase complex ATPase subunit type 1 TsaE [Sphingobacterium sp. SGL-16]|uniref:tRNA (adenosine(37)-N6)-threonylcarbamoyltransferase complex ATPase subunit type 1 TsaE n=1 Tax=Sphingobacterium sp. SGL-16 TaxID=2710883 RepID=UPI0013ECE51B|nr:tRNA (adenosine(37)-N6)-threonylcarbamoyltransferase complex ATPase subunit type 1 TsaE [Sphingobacterium sp. SGL-16]NGM72482.1 tRNA (adenosine(37)-N6)-threonylcarbamoyltransferase complex ATPase subunit type 1 TsaE [Sphingobacterium sp. SGL-16]
MKIEVKDLGELKEAAQQVVKTFSDDRIFLFYGNMGAGKTTFINELCLALGVTEHTSSPTFSIVNEYSIPQGSIYHFDFYRLKNEMEALDMGYEEYFYSGDYCFVEWSEKIPNLIPLHYVKIAIEVLENQHRLITIEKK